MRVLICSISINLQANRASFTTWTIFHSKKMHRKHRNFSICAIVLLNGLLLPGCHSTDNDNNPLDDHGSSVNPPSVPIDLRGVVYSSTAVELEWDAATDDGSVVEYRVYRDGSQVASQSYLRFFDNTLTAGTTHTYSVLAVDDEDNISDAAVIDMTTFDDGPFVSQENYPVILPYVISIANGNLFDDLRAIIDATDVSWLAGSSFDDIAGLTLVDQGDDPSSDLWYVYSYDCEFGGSYTYYKDNWVQFGGLFKGRYDSCRIGNNLLSGNFERSAKLDKAPPNNEQLTSEYSLTVQNDDLGSLRNLTGKLIVDNSQIENRFNFTEASYYEYNLMWSTTISDIEIDVYATDEDPLVNYALPFSRTFDASFRVKGPQTGDKLLTVSIEVETVDVNESYYQSGSLMVTAQDGSSMSLAMTNIGQEAFQVSFTLAESTTALTIAWSDEFRLKCFQAPEFDARLVACF